MQKTYCTKHIAKVYGQAKKNSNYLRIALHMRSSTTVPWIWLFSSCDSLGKSEKIQKRCLRIILDDYESDYEILLDKSGKETTEIKRLPVITINDINPSYMKNTLTMNLWIKLNDILVKHKTASYGD